MSAPTLPIAAPKVEVDPFRYGWRYAVQIDEQGRPVRVQVPLKYEDLLHPQEDDFIVQDVLHDRNCFYLRSVLARAVRRLPGHEVFHDVRTDWEVAGLAALGPDLTVFGNFPADFARGPLGTLRVKHVGLSSVLVIEVTSANTRTNDLVDKVVAYHKARVPLYVVVDYRPEVDEQRIHVFGYRWTQEGYVRLPVDDRERLWLEPLKLWMVGEGERAVCFDEQDRQIPDVEQMADNLQQTEARLEEVMGMTEDAIEQAAEERRGRQKAEEKAADEARARQDAEAKAADEVRARQGAEAKAADEARARHDAEAKAADEARARQDAEQKAADVAAKFAEMEAELRRLRAEAPN